MKKHQTAWKQSFIVLLSLAFAMVSTYSSALDIGVAEHGVLIPYMFTNARNTINTNVTLLNTTGEDITVYYQLFSDTGSRLYDSSLEMTPYDVHMFDFNKFVRKNEIPYLQDYVYGQPCYIVFGLPGNRPQTEALIATAVIEINPQPLSIGRQVPSTASIPVLPLRKDDIVFDGSSNRIEDVDLEIGHHGIAHGQEVTLFHNVDLVPTKLIIWLDNPLPPDLTKVQVMVFDNDESGMSTVIPADPNARLHVVDAADSCGFITRGYFMIGQFFSVFPDDVGGRDGIAFSLFEPTKKSSKTVFSLPTAHY